MATPKARIRRVLREIDPDGQRQRGLAAGLTDKQIAKKTRLDLISVVRPTLRQMEQAGEVEKTVVVYGESARYLLVEPVKPTPPPSLFNQDF